MHKFILRFLQILQEKLVNNGILPIYHKLLDQQRSSKLREVEQALSARGIWTLAFSDKIRGQILQMSSLMTSKISMIILDQHLMPI